MKYMTGFFFPVASIGKFTAMIILYFHLQPQFKYELFHILHIIDGNCHVTQRSNGSFYRCGDHVKEIRFRDYHGMPKGQKFI